MRTETISSRQSRASGRRPGRRRPGGSDGSARSARGPVGDVADGPGARRGPARTAAAAVAAAAVLAAGLGPSQAVAQDDLDVPYVPTPQPVVEKMLELTRPTEDDSLYDLGSGDGRIVVTAAERYGTPGVGVEIDSSRVALARSNAEQAGVDDLVRFVRGDLFEVDVRPASVVTLYLLSSVNLELRPKLFRQLRPGTRVVSHDFDMGEWQADTVVQMPEHNSTVYYWVIPAHVAGVWRVSTPSGETVTVEIQQKFQELRATARDRGVRATEARIRGDRVHLTLVGSGLGRRGEAELSGTVSGGRMIGDPSGGATWSAQRTEGADWPIDRWSTGSGGR